MNRASFFKCLLLSVFGSLFRPKAEASVTLEKEGRSAGKVPEVNIHFSRDMRWEGDKIVASNRVFGAVRVAWGQEIVKFADDGYLGGEVIAIKVCGRWMKPMTQEEAERAQAEAENLGSCIGVEKHNLFA